MSRTWTEPVAIEDHQERLVVYADGQVRRDVDVTLTEAQYRQMRQGYRCCRCYGLVESAFPESCGFPGCDGYSDGFPMRERQAAVMDAEFDGFKWIGPSRETLERIETPTAELDRASGIWTPPGVRN